MTLQEHCKNIEKILKDAGYKASIDFPLQVWNQVQDVSLKVQIFLPVDFDSLDIPLNKEDLK